MDILKHNQAMLQTANLSIKIPTYLAFSLITMRQTCNHKQIRKDNIAQYRCCKLNAHAVVSFYFTFVILKWPRLFVQVNMPINPFCVQRRELFKKYILL